MSQFQLQTTISTSNMHAFDPSGIIKKYELPEDVMEEFFSIRLSLYGKRKDYLEKALAKECEKLSAQARFIKMIVDGDLILSKKKRSKVIAELQSLGFPKWFKVRSEELDLNEDDNETAVNEENEPENDKGYDYLLSLPLSSLTLEKFKLLEDKAQIKLNELDELKRKTPDDLWLADLKELENVLDEMDETEAEIRKEQDVARGRAKRGTSKRRRAAPKKKKTSISSEEEDDNDETSSEDELIESKKKRPSLQKNKPTSVISSSIPVITQSTQISKPPASNLW